MEISTYLEEQIRYYNSPVKNLNRPGKLQTLLAIFWTIPKEIVLNFFSKDRKIFKINRLSSFIFIFIITVYGAELHQYLSQTFQFSFETNRYLQPLKLVYYFAIGSISLIALLLIIIFVFGAPERIVNRKIRKNYFKKHPGPLHFTQKQYSEAAKVLRKLEPIEFKKAVGKYGEEVWHLLFFSNVIFLDRGKWKRLVSIKAIEEDREAGPEDDDE